MRPEGKGRMVRAWNKASALFAGRAGIWEFSQNNISDQKQMDENRKCNCGFNTAAPNCDISLTSPAITLPLSLYLTSTYPAILHPTVS
eukprot:s36_g30.t1